MNGLSCDTLQQLAPELALGALPGDERAAAVLHLEHCSECQLLVEELSTAADALLLAAPEAAPPSGFTRRTLAGFTERPRRRTRFAVALAGALAVAVAAVGIGSLAMRAAPAPRFAIAAPGVRMARFVAAPGEEVEGQVFARAADSSWLFMTISDDGGVTSETYTCQIELVDGRTVDIGSFEVRRGSGSWGRTISDDDANLVKQVRLLDGSGRVAASAEL
ncbi:MAG: zf-HC2 domain-containing protein [Acidimicrobiia bacterium]|nr:zf-HC2 domain-containing protein [Acidimicrobiia bacterium]